MCAIVNIFSIKYGCLNAIYMIKQYHSYKFHIKGLYAECSFVYIMYILRIHYHCCIIVYFSVTDFSKMPYTIDVCLVHLCIHFK